MSAGFEELPGSVFSLFAELLSKRTGLLLPPSRRARLRNRLWAQARAAGSFPRLYAELRDARTESPEFGLLIDAAAIPAGPFLEDESGLLALTLEIAPERLLALQSGEMLDIWCAGCGGGEEPYSLALLLAESGQIPGYRVRIRATDPSPQAIERARGATYGPASLRGVSPERRERFFEAAGPGRWRVREELRVPIVFATRSVFDEPRGGGAFDAILCRTLLPRLAENVRGRAVETLAGFLKPGGYLLLGPADGGAAAATPLTPVRLARDIAWRR